MKLGFIGLTHNSVSEIRTRSVCTNPWGIGILPVQRLKSSAIVLSCPGMWPTSISMPVMAESRQSFSTKKHKGRDMVKSLLLEDSAPVLSDSDFKQIGNLWLGKNFEVIQSSAICARVSKHVILFWRSGFNSRLMSLKSSCVNFWENHLECPRWLVTNPPIWQVSPEAIASTAACPCQYGFGRNERIGCKPESQSWKVW